MAQATSDLTPSGEALSVAVTPSDDRMLALTPHEGARGVRTGAESSSDVD